MYLIAKEHANAFCVFVCLFALLQCISLVCFFSDVMLSQQGTFYTPSLSHTHTASNICLISIVWLAAYKQSTVHHGFLLKGWLSGDLDPTSDVKTFLIITAVVSLHLHLYSKDL